MSLRRHPVRFLIALVVALLVIGALQPPANAVTRRSVSVSVTPATTTSGSVVTFSGRLTKSPKGSVVKIQKKVGTSWVLARSTRTTTATGRYKVRVTLPTIAAIYSYRALAPKKPKLATATSKTVRVAALRKTFVSLNATPASVTAGGSTSLTGFVVPFVKGASVLIQRRNGTSWTNVAVVPLNSSGNYSKSVSVSSTTTFRTTIARSGLNAAGVSSTKTVTATPANPVITTSSLPNGTVGTSYSFALAAAGSPAGTWGASPLPAGLSIVPATGVIQGVPTTAGTTGVTVTFTQTSNGLAATPKNLNLTIDPAVAPVITTTSLPDATKGVAYTTTLTAAGNPAGTWTATPLPAGLTLHASTGVIDGTPTATGDTSVAIGFTQTNTGLAATGKNLNLHVSAPPPPVILTSSLPDGAALTPYSAQVFAGGGVAGTWSATGLPANLSINASSGVISGTPVVATTTTVTINFTQTSTGLAAAPKLLNLHIGLLGAPTTEAEVAAGGQFSCRIDTAKKLWCWGYDDSGELGDGGALQSDPAGVVTPTQVGTATDWTAVTAGRGLITERQACGLRGTAAYCWGSDKFGELGSSAAAGSSTSPVQVDGAHNWHQLSAGSTSTCGVTTTGDLYCWGDNSFGQLGAAGGPQATPQRVGTESTWSQTAAGFNHACAVQGTGTLWCWGANFRGQLGTGDRTSTSAPVQVGSATDWAQVAVGTGYTCATKTTGTLWCWGPSSFGALGNGTAVNDTSTDELSPHQVGSATTWASVSTGDSTTCATNTAGEVWCWGKNLVGQVGDGSTTDRTTPVKVGAATDWGSISVGATHTCGVKSDDEVWCWGSNSKGELGSAPIESSVPNPRKVVG